MYKTKAKGLTIQNNDYPITTPTNNNRSIMTSRKSSANMTYDDYIGSIIYDKPIMIPDYYVNDVEKLKRSCKEIELECIDIVNINRYGKVSKFLRHLERQITLVKAFHNDNDDDNNLIPKDVQFSPILTLSPTTSTMSTITTTTSATSALHDKPYPNSNNDANQRRRKTSSGAYYTYYLIKSIRKEKFEKHPYLLDINLNQLANIDLVRHHNLLQIRKFYQTNNRYYYVMDLLDSTLYQKLNHKRRFHEEDVKSYAFQILDALGHLHYYGYGYPFLDPENIIIDDKGNCFLNYIGKLYKYDQIYDCDYYDFFSLPNEYKAPEMLTKQKITFATDWWAFGILIYELLVGVPPFNTNSKDLLIKLISAKDGNKNNITLHFPKYLELSHEAKDFVQELLQVTPKQRLGYHNDSVHVRNHPWFKNMKFNLSLSTSSGFTSLKSNETMMKHMKIFDESIPEYILESTTPIIEPEFSPSSILS